MSKNLSDKYDKKLLYHARQSTTDAFRTTSRRAIQETAEETGDMIDKKTANNI